MGSGTTHRVTPRMITTAITNAVYGLKQHRDHLI